VVNIFYFIKLDNEIVNLSLPWCNFAKLKNGEKHDTELVMAEVDVVATVVDEAPVKEKRKAEFKAKERSCVEQFSKICETYLISSG
jgi:hypothetical protein